MIKCKVIKKFTMNEFDKLKNIERKSIDTKGMLYIDDIFECDEETAKYLTGDNKDKEVVVEVIEVKPEKKKTTTKGKRNLRKKVQE